MNLMNNSIFYFCFIILIFTVDNVNSKIIELKLKSSDGNGIHPFRIKYDYSQIEKYKDLKYVKNLKKVLDEIGSFFSNLINIKNSKILQTSKIPKEFCDSRIQNFDKQLMNGFDTDLLLFPVIENLDDQMITNKICAKDFDNKRPIIAILIINNKLQFEKKKNLYQYYLQIIHHMLHILGFNKEKLYQSKILKKKAINSVALRKILFSI